MPTRRALGEVEVLMRALPERRTMPGLGGAMWVDYWSLDTEGSELSILNSTDFGAVRFGLLTVELNGQWMAICQLLERNGFAAYPDPGHSDR